MIRTRYAPSPTGRMHVGNLRTALYEYLIARHEGGEFILRIEDTDRERYVEGALDIIYNTMKKAGLEYDEGPDIPGSVGPYIQSERVASGLYMDYAKELVEKGKAYYCFCSKERLEGLKEDNVMMYDKHCLSLSKEEVEAKLASGAAYVIRQNIERQGQTKFTDVIYGEITVENEELDDMILIKSDGYPTYNFANVVDDHLMNITHVVRGNEYLSSTPKYILLYEAFGWDVPTFIHLPLITDEEHHKLSKRSGHASFEDLLEEGFLPEAIVNFVALLGFSPEGNDEILSKGQLINMFDYSRINKSPAVFDMAKLRWMNSEYIKNMDFDAYKEYALPYVKEAIGEESMGRMPLDKILELLKSRIEVFPEIPEKIDFLNELPDYDAAMYTHKKMKTNSENSLEALSEMLPILEGLNDFSYETIHSTTMDYIAKKEVKNGVVLWPLRTAVSGKQSTPGGAFEIMEILGKEESLRRIKIGIEKLRIENRE